MSRIKETSPPQRQTVVPSKKAYIFIAIALLTFGIVFYHKEYSVPPTNPASQWNDSVYGPVIGIDLGHAYTRAAIFVNGTVEMITGDRGASNIPTWGSYWSFNDYPREEFHSVFEGLCKPSQCARRVNGLKLDVETPGYHRLGIDPCYNGLQVSETLQHIQNIASEHLGEPVTHAILVVPAYTTDADQQMFKSMGKSVGLEILRVIEAPNAACIGYNLDRDPECFLRELIVAVVDVGADALRVSVISVDDGVFETLGESHDRTLGGDSYNKVVLEWLAGAEEPRRFIGRYLEETERIKYTMSQPLFLNSSKGYEELVLRDTFERTTSHLIKDSIALVERVLESANKSKTDVDRLILTGGSSKIFRLRSEIESYFDKKPMVLKEGELEEAAVRGAAMLGGILNGSWESDDSICSMSYAMIPLGIETSGGMFQEITLRADMIPARRSKQFYVSNHQRPDQPVKIRAFAGLAKLVKDNIFLGELKVSGLEPGSNFTITMYWNEDDSKGLIVHNSTGITASSNGLLQSGSRLDQDMISVMVENYDRATAWDVGGTLEAQEKVETLKRYIAEAQSGLVLDQLGRQKYDELQFIGETMDWMMRAEYELSLDDVNEKLGQARAVMAEGLDGLPISSEQVYGPYFLVV
ncbi:ATPase with role in protein import into the ER [Ceratobasidium sp. 395]|nr:ATPase with role in protein import into the ER [Ceratobasidium sp. 395]